MDLWTTYSSLSSSASFSISLTTSSSTSFVLFQSIQPPDTKKSHQNPNTQHCIAIIVIPPWLTHQHSTRVWLRDWWLFESCNAIPLQRLTISGLETNNQGGKCLKIIWLLCLILKSYASKLPNFSKKIGGFDTFSMNPETFYLCKKNCHVTTTLQTWTKSNEPRGGV